MNNLNFKKSNEISLLKEKKNQIAVLTLLSVFSSTSNTYAMEKNPLIMMQDTTPQLSLFIFAIIILCGKLFKGEKGDNNLVTDTDPDFLSKLNEFIESTKDQMVSNDITFALANTFVTTLTQYPFTSAVMASLLRFANASWKKENQEIISKLFKKKPYSDNKALLKQEYQNASLQSTMSNNKQLPVHMFRNMGKNIAKKIGKKTSQNVDTAQKAFQRARVAPTLSKKLAEELVNNNQRIIKVTRSTSERIPILEPQQQALPLNLQYTNEPVNSPLFKKLIRAHVILQFQNWIQDEPNPNSIYKGEEILQNALRSIYGELEPRMASVACNGVPFLLQKLDGGLTIESLQAVDLVLNLKSFKKVKLLQKAGLVKSATNQHAEEIASGLHLLLAAMGVNNDYLYTKPLVNVVNDLQLRLFCYGRSLKMGQYSNTIPLLHTTKNFVSAYIAMDTDSSLLEHHLLILCFKIIQSDGNLDLWQNDLLEQMRTLSCSTEQKNQIIRDTIQSFKNNCYVTRNNDNNNSNNNDTAKQK